MYSEKELSYIYENIFLKFQGKLKKGDTITKEMYLPLNLSDKQLNILRKICKLHGLKLEEIDYRLPSVEDEELFKEYNELKDKIRNAPNSPNVKELEKRKIEIRNKIVIDNLPLVRAIIDRNFDKINQVSDREQIYQLGYEILLSLIEYQSILIPKYFTKYISSQLITLIKEKMVKLEVGIGAETKESLEKLIKAKRLLMLTNQNPTLLELSQKLEMEKDYVEGLLNLERLLEVISIDEEKDKLNASEENDNSPLYNGDFEKELIRNLAYDTITKILNTMSKQQQEVIMLAYGLKDGICYNDIEISRILGITNSRVSVVKQKALEKLKKQFVLIT